MLINQEQLIQIELAQMNDLHNEEIERIAKLSAVAGAGETKEVFELLNELISHTVKHFAQEEVLMQEANYPDYHRHKHEHDKQLMDIQSILSFMEMTNDIQSIPSYLEHTLTPWIIEHVEKWDAPASEFLSQ